MSNGPSFPSKSAQNLFFSNSTGYAKNLVWGWDNSLRVQWNNKVVKEYFNQMMFWNNQLALFASTITGLQHFHKPNILVCQQMSMRLHEMLLHVLITSIFQDTIVAMWTLVGMVKALGYKLKGPSPTYSRDLVLFQGVLGSTTIILQIFFLFFFFTSFGGDLKEVSISV